MVRNVFLSYPSRWGNVAGKSLDERRVLLSSWNYAICIVGALVILLAMVPSGNYLSIAMVSNGLLMLYTLFMLTLLLKRTYCKPSEGQKVPDRDLFFNFAVYMIALCFMDLDSLGRMEHGVWPLFIVVLNLSTFLEFQYPMLIHVTYYAWSLLVTVETSSRFGLFDIPGTYPTADRIKRVTCTTPPCSAGFQPAFGLLTIRVASYFMCNYFMTNYAKMLKNNEQSMRELVDTTLKIIDKLKKLRLNEALPLLEELEASASSSDSEKLPELRKKLHEGLNQLCVCMDKYALLFPESIKSAALLPDKDVCLLSVKVADKSVAEQVKSIIKPEGAPATICGYAFERNSRSGPETFTAVYTKKHWKTALEAALDILKDAKGRSANLALTYFKEISYSIEDQNEVDMLRLVAIPDTVVLSSAFFDLNNDKVDCDEPIKDNIPGEIPYHLRSAAKECTPPSWFTQDRPGVAYIRTEGLDIESGIAHPRAGKSIHYVYNVALADEHVTSVKDNIGDLVMMKKPEENMDGKVLIRARVDCGDEYDKVRQYLRVEPKYLDNAREAGLGSMGYIFLSWAKNDVKGLEEFVIYLQEKFSRVKVLAVRGDLQSLPDGETEKPLDMVTGSHFRLLDKLVALSHKYSNHNFYFVSNDGCDTVSEMKGEDLVGEDGYKVYTRLKLC